MESIWLTTSDNPFDYFTQYDQWYEFDESHRYSTSGLIARIANTNNEYSDEQIENDIESAITDILRNGEIYLSMVTDDPKVHYIRIEKPH